MNQNYLEQHKSNASIIRKVSYITLIANVILTILKMFFGILYGNISVISDAVHSLSDVGTTLLVILAVFISKPHSDSKHNYGHEKIEPVLVLFFALILAGTGGLLLTQGITGLITPKNVSLNYYLLAVTILSIVSKEAMYHYTIFYAKKTKSGALKADAWHHRSDSLSSVAVLIGLICSNFIKTDLVENIAVLIVALLIIKVAVQILITAINQLIDKALDEKTSNYLKELVLGVDGVICIDNFQSRLFGNAIYIDIEIGVMEDMSLIDGHNIAHTVHDKLENSSGQPVKHCNVHINPIKCKKESEEE